MPPAPENKHQINHHHKAESQETDPFLSETEKGSFEKQWWKRFPIWNRYLIFLLLCAYFESQIFWTRPWHSLVWYFNAFKVAGCLRVCLCVCMAEWSSEWLWCRFCHNPLLHPTSNPTPHTGYLKLYAQLANWDPIFVSTFWYLCNFLVNTHAFKTKKKGSKNSVSVPILSQSMIWKRLSFLNNNSCFSSHSASSGHVGSHFCGSGGATLWPSGATLAAAVAVAVAHHLSWKGAGNPQLQSNLCRATTPWR